jgi:hypothetical protein
VCFLCFANGESYVPPGTNLIKRRYGLDRKDIRKIPHMKPLASIYSPGQCNSLYQLHCSTTFTFSIAAILRHGSKDAISTYITSVQDQSQREHEKRRKNALADGSNTYRIRSPAQLFLHDSKSSNPLRFHAIVAVPFLSHCSMIPEYGFHCKGCSNSNRLPLYWRGTC